jgi:alkylhydroperoxidase family enzyme
MKAALAALMPADPRHPLPQRDPSRPKGLNILGTLAQHPELATAYHTFNGHILFSTTLSLRQRELLVLRVAALRDAEYEWAQHVVMAGDVGISDEEVERIAAGPEAVLAEQLDQRQLMDLIFTVGAYDVLAMLMRSAGMELDADLREWKRGSQ